MDSDDTNNAPSAGKLFNPKKMQARIDRLNAARKMPTLGEFREGEGSDGYH